jgi:signal transduction histidine kinase
MFSFMPTVVEQAWNAIRPRILLMNSEQIEQLDALAAQFAPVAPDYATVMRFSRLMLAHLPEPLEEPRSEKTEGQSVAQRQESTSKRHGDRQNFHHHSAPSHYQTMPLPDAASLDVELLQALAHEIRTPLTTIRTLTRSLLKRIDLLPMY